VRIERTDMIAGLSAFQARELMRRLCDRVFSEVAIERVLGVGRDEGATVLADLRSAGLVAETAGGWVTTIAGNALAMAKASKPVSRPVAERHLRALVERADAINADPQYLFWVERLVVFGSYLDSGVEALGDLDLAVDLVCRFEDGAEYLRRARDRVRVATGRSGSVEKQLVWPQSEVLTILKARSRVLSLVVDDDILRQANTRLVYHRKSSRSAQAHHEVGNGT
jgi:hypothetical protein